MLAGLRSKRTSPYLLLTLAPVFWSCNWIVGRALATEVPPLTMTFLRWLFAIAMLAPFAWRYVRRDWPIVRRHWKVMIALGIPGICGHNALAYFGLHYTTATNGVILNSFVPVMIIALSWIFLGERLSRVQLAGVAVSLVGVLTILSRGDVATLAAFRPNVGDVFVLASILAWSLYTIGLRWRPAGIHLMSFLFVLACVGDLAVLPLAAVEWWVRQRIDLTFANLAAIALVSLVSSVLAYIAWNRGVELVGASMAGLFVHLSPVSGVVLAWLFLDERLAPFHLAGIALILAGIYVTSRAGRRLLPAPAGTD